MAMASVLRRFLFLAATASIVIPTVAAKFAPQQQKVVESAIGTALGYLCPSGNAFSCPTLDFITSFGLVFFSMWLGLSMVPQFRGGGLGEGGAQTALLGIAAFMGLGSAFYVWYSQIAFLAFIAPFGLFIVAAVLGLTAASFVFGGGAEASMSHKVIMAGFVMLIMAIAMSYFNPDNAGWWGVLGFAGFLVLVFGFVGLGHGTLAAGAGGGGGGFLGGLFGQRPQLPAPGAEQRIEAEVAQMPEILRVAAAAPTPAERGAALDRIIAEMGDVIAHG